MTCLRKCGFSFVSPYFIMRDEKFLNSQRSNANCLEIVGNSLLAPYQYLFGAKEYEIEFDDGTKSMQVRKVTHKFNYDDPLWSQILKTIAAILLLPITLPLGAVLKGLAYLCKDVRASHDLIESYSIAGSFKPTNYAELGLPSELYSIDSELNGSNTVATLGLPRSEKDLEEIRLGMRDELKVLKCVFEVLEQNHIPAWLEWGSCLGAFRHGGMIPWDRDIDIAILEIDFANFKRVLQDTIGNEVDIQDWSPYHAPNTFYRLHVKKTDYMIDVYTYHIIEEVASKSVDLEPFIPKEVRLKMGSREEITSTVDKDRIWDLVDKKVIQYNASEWMCMPPSWRVRELEARRPRPVEALFPLKRASFDYVNDDAELTTMQVPVPNQIDKWLQSVYGLLAPTMYFDESEKKYKAVEGHPYWDINPVEVV